MYCFSLSVSIDNLNIDVNFSLFVSPQQHQSSFTQGAASSWSSSPHSCSSFSTSWASRWRRWRRRRRWWRRGIERGEKGIDSLLLLGGAASTSPASAQKRVYSSLQRGLCSSQVTHIRNRNDKIRSAPPCSHHYEAAISLAGT